MKNKAYLSFLYLLVLLSQPEVVKIPPQSIKFCVSQTHGQQQIKQVIDGEPDQQRTQPTLSLIYQ